LTKTYKYVKTKLTFKKTNMGDKTIKLGISKKGLLDETKRVKKLNIKFIPNKNGWQTKFTQ
jgi:hypothetical protein